MAKIIKIGDIEIEKQNFHQHEELISLKKLYINTITVSSKVIFGNKGFKYFLGYKDARKIRPQCIFLPKMTAY